MFPASRAACVPVFIATPTSACGERRRVVGAVAGHRDEVARRPARAGSAPSCPRASPRRGSRRRRPRRRSPSAVSGLSPVIITVRMPIARSSVEALAHALLDDVLEVDRRRARAPSSATTSGVPPRRRSRSTIVARARPARAAVLCDPAPDRVGRALADRAAVEVDAAHPRLRRERDERRRRRARARGARTAPWRARRSSGPRASRRRGWRAARRRPARCSSTPGSGTELGRLAVAERDRAGLVEQQTSSSRPPPRPRGPEIASTLRRTSRSMPAIPIAESSAPIVVGIRQTSSATSTIGGCCSRAGVDARTAAASTTASRKTIVSPASRM